MKKEQWAALWAKAKKGKPLYWALYGGMLLLALFFYGMGDGWFARASPPSVKEASYEGEELERRLESILSRIRGAGEVRVLITYETTAERITATVSTLDESVAESSGTGSATHSEQTRETRQPATVTTDQGQTPIILVEREPSIRGVIVVAEGAADPTVRLSLQRAVQAVTGVALSAVEVFEMGYAS